MFDEMAGNKESRTFKSGAPCYSRVQQLWLLYRRPALTGMTDGLVLHLLEFFQCENSRGVHHSLPRIKMGILWAILVFVELERVCSRENN